MEIVVLNRDRKREGCELVAELAESRRKRKELLDLVRCKAVVAFEEGLVGVGDNRKSQVAEPHVEQLIDVLDLADLKLAVQTERGRVGLDGSGVGNLRAAVAN